MGLFWVGLRCSFGVGSGCLFKGALGVAWGRFTVFILGWFRVVLLACLLARLPGMEIENVP